MFKYLFLSRTPMAWAQRDYPESNYQDNYQDNRLSRFTRYQDNRISRFTRYQDNITSRFTR